MKLNIRQANKGDLEEIASLLDQLGFPTNENEVEDRLREVERSSPDEVLVALAVDRVVGFVSLHVIPYFTTGTRVCRVLALSVQEGVRKQGIGRALMEAAEGFAIEAGCRAIEVTSADFRKDAHAFYARLDYPKTAAKFFKELDDIT